MARRTKEDAEKTRESLLDAAEKVFMRDGVAASTLEDIAREAGVTRGAVYWHFENKMEIFKAMNARVRLPIDQMYERWFVDGNAIAAMKRICVEVMRTTARDEHMRNVFTIMRLRCEQLNRSNDGFAQEITTKRDETIQRFKKVFAEAARQGQLAPGITPIFAATSLHCFISGVFWDYLRDPESFPLTKLAPKLVDSFFCGLVRADLATTK